MCAARRSPKIPLSPSSPPETGLKRRRSPEVVGNLPLSPEYMSVATKSYVSSYGNTSHMDEAASRSSPRSPSSSSSYNHSSTRRASHTYSTPTSSTSGIPGLNMLDDADQHRNKRQKVESHANGNKDEVSGNTPLLATNLEQQNYCKEEEGQTSAMADIEMNSDLQAAQNVKEVSLEQLEEDMGDAFLLCRSKVPLQRPNPQKHLLNMYDLGPLLRNVARTDPLTGEKINKLRKSYEGQLKNFNLAGKNKPRECVRDKGNYEPGPIRTAIGSTNDDGLMPARRWDVEDSEDRKIELSAAFKSRIKTGMQLHPGPIMHGKKWEDLLGNDPPPRQAPISAPEQVAPHVQRAPNGVVRSQGAHPDIRRQTRGKKRSYQDDSFSGYAEGFSEGEDPDDHGDADRFGSRKRRKESVGGPGILPNLVGQS